MKHATIRIKLDDIILKKLRNKKQNNNPIKNGEKEIEVIGKTLMLIGLRGLWDPLQVNKKMNVQWLGAELKDI